MLREQHLRKIEECLTEAIAAARIAGMTDEELLFTLETLIQVTAEE